MKNGEHESGLMRLVNLFVRLVCARVAALIFMLAFNDLRELRDCLGKGQGL